MNPTVCPASEVFLSIFFLVINLKNYHLVSPPNPAEVCDVDFGFPTDHTLGRYQNTPSAMEKNISQWLDNVPFVGREHFHCNVDFEECLGSLGRLHFSHVKGSWKNSCAVTEEFSWTPQKDIPLTPIEGQTTLYFMKGTKSHSTVVLIFEGYKISGINNF